MEKEREQTRDGAEGREETRKGREGREGVSSS